MLCSWQTGKVPKLLFSSPFIRTNLFMRHSPNDLITSKKALLLDATTIGINFPTRNFPMNVGEYIDCSPKA